MSENLTTPSRIVVSILMSNSSSTILSIEFTIPPSPPSCSSIRNTTSPGHSCIVELVVVVDDVVPEHSHWRYSLVSTEITSASVRT